MLFIYYIKIISFYHFKEHIMYTVYYIFICHISFFYTYIYIGTMWVNARLHSNLTCKVFWKWQRFPPRQARDGSITLHDTKYSKLSTPLTKYSGHKRKWEFWREHREEPGSGVVNGSDLVCLQVAVQVWVVVVEQPRQLVELDLRWQEREVAFKQWRNKLIHKWFR